VTDNIYTWLNIWSQYIGTIYYGSVTDIHIRLAPTDVCS